MKRPKGILLDYGGTLVEEAGFDPHAGNTWLLAQASYVAPGVTLEKVLERAHRVASEVADRRDKFGLEFRIIDSEAISNLRRKRGIHVNPWSHFPRLITSIDFKLPAMFFINSIRLLPVPPSPENSPA